jgi:putative transcriptional regulator
MKKTKSPILEAVHETARGLYEVGAIDKITMREYDQLCLQTVEPLAPEQIKQIREDAHVSQAIFAQQFQIQNLDRKARYPRG